MRCLNKETLKSKIDARLLQDICENKLFGAAIHVSQNGETIYETAMGLADPARGMPVTDRTVFRIASMTKPITAVAALILAERKLISLDDPVEKFLPEFNGLHLAFLDGNGMLGERGAVREKPTIRNILSHTSGIGSGKTGAVQIEKMSAADKSTLENTVTYFSRQGLSFEPGSQQEYSGFPSYDVLTAIIERVTAEDYSSFLKREVFTKCEMLDTVFVPTEDQWNRFAVMHDRVDGKNTVSPMPDGSVFEGIPCSHYLGGAGLVSTLHDYAHFTQMLLQDGVYNGARILSPMSVKQIGTPQVPDSVQPGVQRWGLGVRVIVSESYKFLPIGSYGWSGAYGPHFWIDPVNRIAAVYMKNSRYDRGAGSVTGYNFEQDVYDSLM